MPQELSLWCETQHMLLLCPGTSSTTHIQTLLSCVLCCQHLPVPPAPWPQENANWTSSMIESLVVWNCPSLNVWIIWIFTCLDFWLLQLLSAHHFKHSTVQWFNCLSILQTFTDSQIQASLYIHFQTSISQTFKDAIVEDSLFHALLTPPPCYLQIVPG